MKSFRVVYLLVVISSISVHAIDLNDIVATPLNNTQIDSLYSSIFLERNRDSISASTTIENYEKTTAKNKDLELSNEDLKKIALSYCHIGDHTRGTSYLAQYIQKSFDIGILDRYDFDNIKESEEFKALVFRYKPKFDLWILFFIASGVIGVFISIVINFRKKGDQIANLLIGLFVFFHSLFVLHLSLYLTNYSYTVPHSFWATITFSFLYGPLIYFYFKRVTSKYVFKWRDLIHLFPTLCLIIYFIPIYLLPEEVKQFKLFNVDTKFATELSIIVIIKAISILTYSILAYNLYKKKRLSKSKIDPQINIWHRNMAVLNIFYGVTYSIYAFILATKVVFYKNNNVMLYSQVVVLVSIVLYVAYTAYVQPRVFSKKHIFNELTLKYEKSGLTESFSNELKAQLLKLLNDEKIFKDNSLNLNSLSERMGVTRHNLSQVINEHFDVNFFNLINKYRIQEAQEIFRNDYNKNLNIIDVAYDVGFNNKVTFNKAFKDETNLTPTQYIQTIHRLHPG